MKVTIEIIIYLNYPRLKILRPSSNWLCQYEVSIRNLLIHIIFGEVKRKWNQSIERKENHLYPKKRKEDREKYHMGISKSNSYIWLGAYCLCWQDAWGSTTTNLKPLYTIQRNTAFSLLLLLLNMRWVSIYRVYSTKGVWSRVGGLGVLSWTYFNLWC